MKNAKCEDTPCEKVQRNDKNKEEDRNREDKLKMFADEGDREVGKYGESKKMVISPTTTTFSSSHLDSLKLQEPKQH